MKKEPYANLLKGLLKEEVIAHKLEALLQQKKIPEIVTVTNRVHDSASDDYFHPSIHTMPDARELYFLLHPQLKKDLKPRDRSVKDTMTMYFGTAYHAIVQQTLVESGFSKQEDIEIPLIDDEHHWRGHLDLVHEGIPIDIKTMNPEVYKWATEEKGPKEPYDKQVNCYLTKYPDAPHGILLLLEMGYPFRIKEMKVERKPGMTRMLFNKWDFVRERIAMNTPPKELCCPTSGPKFEKCAARFMCIERLS